MAKKSKILDKKTLKAIQEVVYSAINANANTVSLNGNITSNLSSWVLPSATKRSSFAGLSTGKVYIDEPKTLPPIRGELHVSKFDHEPRMFHTSVFKKLYPDIDYTRVSRITDVNKDEMSLYQLAFYTKEHVETYDAWLSEYMEKYGAHQEMMLPPPMGDFPYLVKSDFNRSTDKSLGEADERALEQWVFILQNCNGEARHTGDFWFFAEEGDAVLFKVAF